MPGEINANPLPHPDANGTIRDDGDYLPFSPEELAAARIVDVDAVGVDEEEVAPPFAEEREKPAGRQTERVVRGRPEPDSAPAPADAAKLARAEEALASGDWETALAFAQEAAREAGTANRARVIIARVFMEQGEDAKALSVMRAMTGSDETAESLYYRGLAAARLNKTDEAAKCLEKALLLPESDAARHNACRALYDRIVFAREKSGDRVANGEAARARPLPLERIGRRPRRRFPFNFF